MADNFSNPRRYDEPRLGFFSLLSYNDSICIFHSVLLGAKLKSV
jgi:hypothetical protein